MDINTYTKLTGIQVAEDDIGRYTAQIRQAKSKLEGLLGYTLQKGKTIDNGFEELGKSIEECGCYSDGDNLNPPDDIIGAYRLFSYNQHDEFLAVDPFRAVYAVKLVYLKQGSNAMGVTVKTLTRARPIIKNGFGRYLQDCRIELCDCICEDCLMLAVDADWLFDDCLPDELSYIWADMVTYGASNKKDIKSETLGSHSYTKFEQGNPLDDKENLKIISKYAGPNGTLFSMPV